MAITCPNCGRAVRPGSKFCSKCGAEMPGTLPLARLPQAAPAAPQQQSLCPHCGKPVRPGARFCASCGSGIHEETPAASPSPAPPAAAPPPLTSAASGEAPPALIKTSPRTPAPPKPAASSPAKKTARINKWLVIAVAGATLLACLAVIAAFVLFKDRLPALLGRVGAAPTAEVLPSETITLTPPASQTPPGTPTKTATSLPSPTATPEPTRTAATPLASPEAGAALFEDDFSAGWEKNWSAWGNPPVVGGENISLTLNSAALYDAGISARQTIALREDVTIEFAAKLNGSSPQDALFFDWTVGTETRTSGTPPGAIHLQIGAGVIQLSVADSAATYASCAPRPFDGIDVHIYQLEIEDDWILKLQMDGKQVCELEVKPYSGGRDLTGMISFSGRGTLDDIHVSMDD